ncbi:hypothetical protein [Sphingomonas sp. CBMAI 2297]|uniref:DUF6968 family protein n=1 Tax=Sphingomonas sp. CBMAI 2297 TaxID=2991720 RepID=UPI002454FFF7|nr:hypothetical protein [Sphingomonas sp. CBMAI 2297]
MNALSIGNVIATREIDLGPSAKVEVVIGAPFSIDATGEEFWCPYRIIGIGSGKVKRAIGADSLQALVLALYDISNALYFSEEFERGELRWAGGMTFADFGIPVSERTIDEVRQARQRIEG